MSKHPTLFITHRELVHQQRALDAAPPELDVTMRCDITKSDLIRLLPGMEFLVSERADLIDAEVIAAGKNLRLIQRLGSQTWDIDLEAARKAEVIVCRYPVRSCIAVAEHILMQMLCVARHTREMMLLMNRAEWQIAPRQTNENVFAYNWTQQERIFSLWQKTVGILGFGEIGLELANRLRGFDCQVLYNKRKPLPEQIEQELQVVYKSKNDLIRESDIVGSLLPFVKEVGQRFDAAFFAQMKPGAFFVNCGGAPVDELALMEALRSGHLAGAALDTYSWEPFPPEHPLLDMARDLRYNLVLTPHIAAATFEKVRRQEDYTNIQKLLKGEPLRYRVV